MALDELSEAAPSVTSLLSAMRILVVIFRMLTGVGEVKLENYFISTVKEYEPVEKSRGRERIRCSRKDS